jgi:hypothetical protein
MKWITRECPKIDRSACPWLISRFIDVEDFRRNGLRWSVAEPCGRDSCVLK